MKIGIVLSKTPGYSETFLRTKIKGLQENGFEVELFCQHHHVDFDLCPTITSPKVSKNLLLQFVYFIKEFSLLLPYLPVVLRYIRLERKEDTNLKQLVKKIYLNAHLLKSKLDWLYFGFATLALGRESVAKTIGAKMAVSFRGFDIAVYPVKHPGCFNLLWKYVDRIHTNSTDLWDVAKNHGLPTTIPVIKITPAIDVEIFKSTSEWLPKHGVLSFMTTGRLHWKKGLVPTLEALTLLKAQGFNFTYKIIGEGQEYERIAFAAYQLGLEANVRFLGKMTPLQIKAELENTDIYLQYSTQEGFCNAVLEAQAMGKLCIVSDAEGLSENILHEETGWVVPKYNPYLLAQQIKNVLLMDDTLKATISKNAKERVREEFNIEKQQRKFLEFYDAANEP